MLYIHFTQGSTEEFHLLMQGVGYRQPPEKLWIPLAAAEQKSQVTFMLGQALRSEKEHAEVQLSSMKLWHTTGGRKIGVWSLKETLHGADLASKGNLSCRGKRSGMCPSWAGGGWRN